MIRCIDTFINFIDRSDFEDVLRRAHFAERPLLDNPFESHSMLLFTRFDSFQLGVRLMVVIEEKRLHLLLLLIGVNEDFFRIDREPGVIDPFDLFLASKSNCLPLLELFIISKEN